MLIINNNTKGKTTNIKGRKIFGRKWVIIATPLCNPALIFTTKTEPSLPTQPALSFVPSQRQSNHQTY